MPMRRLLVLVPLAPVLLCAWSHPPWLALDAQTPQPLAGAGWSSDSQGPNWETTPRTTMEKEKEELDNAVERATEVFDDHRSAPPANQNVVSVHQLLAPLSRKGARLVKKAQSYLRKGQRDLAKEELTKAKRDPSAAPYARAMLAAEYLRDGQAAAAVAELEIAAPVLPIASVHSNLGYALCLTGHERRCQQELAEALRLDGTSAKTRFLMGLVLLDERSRDGEAEYDFRIAQGQVSSASLALAVCQLRRGKTDTARDEIRRYLGPYRLAGLPDLWRWAEAVASSAHPAEAFGFPSEPSN